MVGKNIKYLRNYDNLSQTAFGKLFKYKGEPVTRGMIDSYEREVCKPDTIVLEQIAERYKLSIETIRSKDISLNPGLVHAGAFTLDSHTVDLLKAKDELIKQLKAQVKYLEEQNQVLLRQLSKKVA
jgi:transcriptional regulator with XRE-family HTH domain